MPRVEPSSIAVNSVFLAALVAPTLACVGHHDDAPGSLGSGGSSVTYSDPGVVASHADIVAATPDGTNIIDAPLVSFVVAGERRWIASTVKWFDNGDGEDDFHVYHMLLSGGLDRPLTTLHSTKRQWELFSNWTDFPGRWWIVNSYQDGDGILAFVHVEFAAGMNEGGVQRRFGRARLGLAWSDDGGASFRYLGNIIVPENDPVDFNVEAAPYVIKDGQFHVYFRDSAGIAVARAPVAAVIDAARGGGAMPEWRKWNGGSWTPGIGGRASPLAVTGITHTDAAYSTATGKYYLATTTQKSGATPSTINLYESADAIEWNLLDTLLPIADVSLGWQYLSFVDTSGSDNGVVGDRFFLYCGREPIDSARSEIHRVEIFPEGGGDPPPSPPEPPPAEPPPADPPPAGPPPADPPPAGPPYVGTFKVGTSLYYSSGSVYCYYDNWHDFTCSTGLTNADSVTSFASLPDYLAPGGVCYDPACAYVGIFRVGPGVCYSNGSAYCHYDTWGHFMCMTGLTSADQFPVFDHAPSYLESAGPCQVPPNCS